MRMFGCVSGSGGAASSQAVIETKPAKPSDKKSLRELNRRLWERGLMQFFGESEGAGQGRLKLEACRGIVSVPGEPVNSGCRAREDEGISRVFAKAPVIVFDLHSTSFTLAFYVFQDQKKQSDSCHR